MPRVMTLRLDEDMLRDLEMVARVRGVPVAHAIRIAIARYLASLPGDHEFQKRALEAQFEAQNTWERLSGRREET